MTPHYTEWADRYGGHYPDPAVTCPGPCEGMGYFPSDDPSEWPEGAEPDNIGYVFVRCPECNGTGKRAEPPTAESGLKMDLEEARQTIERAVERPGVEVPPDKLALAVATVLVRNGLLGASLSQVTLNVVIANEV